MNLAHEAAKRNAIAEALAYAGPRMSTVGPRVRPGPRVPRGEALRVDDPAREFLRKERRPPMPGTKGRPACPPPHECLGYCGYRVLPEKRPVVHWSEVQR